MAPAAHVVARGGEQSVREEQRVRALLRGVVRAERLAVAAVAVDRLPVGQRQRAVAPVLLQEGGAARGVGGADARGRHAGGARRAQRALELEVERRLLGEACREKESGRGGRGRVT